MRYTWFVKKKGRQSDSARRGNAAPDPIHGKEATQMKRGYLVLLVLTLSLVVTLVACTGGNGFSCCGACNLACAACTACTAIGCAGSCLNAFMNSASAAYNTASSVTGS